jgi:hypothetical protein
MMRRAGSTLGWPYYALTALALSVGWGIRGNFGHEYGAMIPGALAAMAVVLLSGRDDWQRRVSYFAMFGALGWSFGGSISYMQVVGYTHSGHSPSVLYGFANLFVIGFLWAAPGGAGTALPAFADRERLTELFVPMTAVFLAWWLQGWVRIPRVAVLDTYDTDWVAASLAILATLLVCLARRRFDRSTSLILHMAIGWWVGFALLVLGLRLRMTPPRGDNWAGCLGMSAGLFVYLVRSGLQPVAQAMLVTGFLGGIGFAAASMLKLVEITSGFETNWHSILEQTTGLFNGLALAVAMAGAARSAPRVLDEPRVRRWTEIYAVGFVLVLITYLNFRKNVGNWTAAKAVPDFLAGLPAWAWFDLAYALIAVAVLVPLIVHRFRPLPLLDMSWLARGSWLFLVFLWWVVAGNFERIVVAFTPQRLVTEGVIHLNAVLCTLLVAVGSCSERREPTSLQSRLGRTMLVGLVAASISVLIDWGVVRLVHGDRYVGKAYSGLHIRFGPNATTHLKNGK